MRSLLVKSSLIVSIALSMGVGITLAAASSKPGMFLYPVKQVTQKAIGALGGTTVIEVPAILPQNGGGQEPTATESRPVDDTYPDTDQKPADVEDTVVVGDVSADEMVESPLSIGETDEPSDQARTAPTTDETTDDSPVDNSGDVRSSNDHDD